MTTNTLSLDAIMRRIQWARFTRQPVTFTEDEALSLLFDAASDSDFYDVCDEDAFWRSIGGAESRTYTFVMHRDSWPFYNWDSAERRWVPNARLSLLNARRDEMREDPAMRRLSLDDWAKMSEVIRLECAKAKI